VLLQLKKYQINMSFPTCLQQSTTFLQCSALQQANQPNAAMLKKNTASKTKQLTAVENGI